MLVFVAILYAPYFLGLMVANSVEFLDLKALLNDPKVALTSS